MRFQFDRDQRIAGAEKQGRGLIAAHLSRETARRRRLALAAIPVALAYVTKAHETKRAVLFGATLLLAFAMGRAVPIILGAWAVGWLEGLEPLRHSQKIFEIMGAVLLILSGIYMLNAYFLFIPELAV